MDSRAKLVGNIVDSIAELGFSDIKSNPKHGTIEIPGATMGDRSRIRIMLLQIREGFGWPRANAPMFHLPQIRCRDDW